MSNKQPECLCLCWKCNFGRHLNMFVVCPTCGNKRCPKASDHSLACTGSNEPGQPGSVYASSSETGIISASMKAK